MQKYGFSDVNLAGGSNYNSVPDDSLKMDKHIHFIAIGGAAMHNLALALQKNGFHITGSDDEIKEPSLSRLEKAGLLPAESGWFPEKLDEKPGTVILGMHARADNPELLRAKELGLKICSFPEYLYEHSRNKKRVVIGGSHGKTTITSMIMHVLRLTGKNFDYMVGSTVEGFDTMVRLSNDAPVIILEGDEYLSSPVDRRPKFHLYKADIGLLSGVAWDHINVFPTFENYVEQFRIFAEGIPVGGSLVFYDEDVHLQNIANGLETGVNQIPYGAPDFSIDENRTVVHFENRDFPLKIFGKHNLANLEGARKICELLGVSGTEFYEASMSFSGAGRRLELVSQKNGSLVFRDFAHSPSKLQATIDAVKEQYPEHELIACMELHTFSSLSENFLDQYRGTMKNASVPIVYFNPSTIQHKKLAPITTEQVKNAFADERVRVINNSDDLLAAIKENFKGKSVLLMMSSGTFDGLDMKAATDN